MMYLQKISKSALWDIFIIIFTNFFFQIQLYLGWETGFYSFIVLMAFLLIPSFVFLPSSVLLHFYFWIQLPDYLLESSDISSINSFLLLLSLVIVVLAPFLSFWWITRLQCDDFSDKIITQKFFIKQKGILVGGYYGILSFSFILAYLGLNDFFLLLIVAVITKHFFAKINKSSYKSFLTDHEIAALPSDGLSEFPNRFAYFSSLIVFYLGVIVSSYFGIFLLFPMQNFISFFLFVLVSSFLTYYLYSIVFINIRKLESMKQKEFATQWIG